ncbi:MAG TPA: hypothetical protein VI653_15310 [Steroidobacteraceae bacterium]
MACAGMPALADLPNPLADGLRHCAGESDQASRLACFDALAAGLPKVEADQFGLTADIAHKRLAVDASEAGAPSATKHTEPKKPAGQFLPGKITALRQAAGGVLVFTLDNHQVWAQADADTRFSFAVGDEVRIERGAMGSFWLAANKGRKTKVKRIS